MKFKIISFCLLFVAIFLSCKKEGPLDVGNANILLLSTVTIDNQPSFEYLYNGANLVSEEKSKVDYTIHHYNDKNQLVTSDYYVNYNILSSDLQVFGTAMNITEWVTPDNVNKGGTFKYEYNDNGQLIKTTFSRTSSGSSEYSEFSYDVNNRISIQTLYWENNETGYIEYSYDAKGNLIKEILYNVSATGVAELSTTTLYEFDNEQNPYKSFGGLMTPGIRTNRNNIIKETNMIYLNADKVADKAQITQTSYTYNGTGYPISKNGNTQYLYKMMPGSLQINHYLDNNVYIATN